MNMSRPNQINFVEAIYQANPRLNDYDVQQAVGIVFGTEPTLKTVSVWKARLRAKGVDIPDRRKKEAIK